MDIDSQKITPAKPSGGNLPPRGSSDMTLAEISAKNTQGKAFHPQVIGKNGKPVFNVSSAFKNAGHVEAGTIVSDTRRDHPSLGTSLKEVGIEWWEGIQKAVSRITPSTDEKPLTQPVPVPPQKISVPEMPLKQTPIHLEQSVTQQTHTIEGSRTFKKDVARVHAIPIPTTNVEVVPTGDSVTEKPLTVASANRLIPPATEIPDMRMSMVAPEVTEEVRDEIRKYIPTQPRPKETNVSTISDVVPQSTMGDTVPEQMPESVPPVIEVPLQTNPVSVAPEVTQEAYTPPPAPPPLIVSQEKVTQVASIQEIIPSKPVEPREIEEIIMVAHEIPNLKETSDDIVNQRFHSNTPTTKTTAQRNVSGSLQVPTTMTFLPQTIHTSFSLITKWGIRIGIASLGIVLAFVAGTYFNTLRNTLNEDVEATIIPTPAFFEASQIPLPIEESAGQYLEILASFIDSAPTSLTQFYPARATATSVRPMTSSEFFSFIEARLPSKTLRTLEDTFMIGSVPTHQNEPFIILRSYNFDVLFTGMLTWESYLYADLAPLMSGSYAGGKKFVDDIHENRPIRILYSETDATVLLYAFVNQNTVVITTSKEALSELFTHF